MTKEPDSLSVLATGEIASNDHESANSTTTKSDTLEELIMLAATDSNSDINQSLMNQLFSCASTATGTTTEADPSETVSSDTTQHQKQPLRRTSSRPRLPPARINPEPVTVSKKVGRKSTIPVSDEEERQHYIKIKKRRASTDDGPIDMALMKALGLRGVKKEMQNNGLDSMSNSNPGAASNISEHTSLEDLLNSIVCGQRPATFTNQPTVSNGRSSTTPSDKNTKKTTPRTKQPYVRTNPKTRYEISTQELIAAPFGNESASRDNSSTPPLFVTNLKQEDDADVFYTSANSQQTEQARSFSKVGSCSTSRSFDVEECERESPPMGHATIQSTKPLHLPITQPVPVLTEHDPETQRLYRQALVAQIEKDEAAREYYRLKSLKLQKELGLLP